MGFAVHVSWKTYMIWINLMLLRACVELKHQKELELIWKRDEEEEKLRQKVLAIHGKEEAWWTAGDVQVIISWFKRPGESKMPSIKELLKQQYEQTKNRSENDCTYLSQGEVAIVDDAGDEQNVGNRVGDGGEWPNRRCLVVLWASEVRMHWCGCGARRIFYAFFCAWCTI